MLRTLKYTCINFQYLCDHFDEYGISLKTPEADTSDSNEEGLMALHVKYKVKNLTYD